MMLKAWCCLADMSYCFSRTSVTFQGHMANKSPILTQIGRFRTVTPVWIYQSIMNNAQSLKQHRKGALFVFKVICQISGSHGTNIVDFNPNLAFPDCYSSFTPWFWNDAQGLMLYRRCALLFFKVMHQLSRSRGTKKHQIWPELSVFGIILTFDFTDVTAWLDIDV